MHSDKDKAMPFVGGPNTLITNPRWRTAAILKKIEKWPYLMPKTHAPETGARKQRQKTGVGFWRRFFMPVAKLLAPETNTDE